MNGGGDKGAAIHILKGQAGCSALLKLGETLLQCKGNVLGVLCWFIYLESIYISLKICIRLINFTVFMWILIPECSAIKWRLNVQVLLTLYAMHFWKIISFCDILAILFCFKCKQWFFFFPCIIYWLWFYGISYF